MKLGVLGKAFVVLMAVALCWGAPAAARESFTIDPQQSSVTYRVEETFFMGAIRRGTAVGVTRGIEGTIYVDLNNLGELSATPVRVDISQFKSDNERRDERIRGEWLESARYPIAEFVVRSVEGLDGGVALGEEVQVKVHGDLTVRNVTRPTTFEGVLTLTEDRIEGTLRSRVLMTDFGFDPPSIAGVLRAENEVDLEFQLVAVRGEKQ